MNGTLGTNFKRCVEFRDAKSSLLKKYKDDFDFDELCKLAIDYSDGVIAAKPDVSDTLMQYAADNGIPTLPWPGEDFHDAYEDFYEKI
jgi:starch synthase